jgi:hypothetical protein
MGLEADITRGKSVALVVWNPDLAECKYTGHLRWKSDSDIRLSITGRFGPHDLERLRGNPRVLFGTAATGESVTLDECFAYSEQSASRGMTTIHFGPNSIFVGGHIPADGDAETRELHARLSSFDWWAEIFLGESVDPRHPERTEVHLTEFDGFSLLAVGVDQVTHGLYRYAVRRRPELRIVADRPRPLAQFRYVLQRFMSFLTLCSSHRVRITRLAVSVSSVSLRRRDEEPWYPSMPVLGLLRLQNARPQKVGQHEMFVRRHQLREKTANVLSNWLRRAVELRPVHDLYAYAAHNRELAVPMRFLNLVQALEVFHRKALQPSTPSEHERKVHAILRSAPENYRTWLAERLQFSHEPSLNFRLKELFRAASPIIDNPSTPAVKVFANRTKEWRNQLTHFSRPEGDFAMKDLELLNLSNWIVLVLEYWLLRDAGLDDAELKEVFAVNRRYRAGRYGPNLEIEYSSDSQLPIHTDVVTLDTPPKAPGEVF